MSSRRSALSLSLSGKPKRQTAVVHCDGQKRDGWIAECLGHDLRVIVRETLCVGDRVTLDLYSLSGDERKSLPGIIHWVGPFRNEFALGVVTRTPVPAAFHLRTPGCQRHELRFPCQVDGMLEMEDGAPVGRVRIVNYSRSGVAFESSLPPRIGGNFRFSWGSPGQMLEISGNVHWVIGQPNGFLAGGELTSGYGYDVAEPLNTAL